jgi:hypothetical protein
MSISKLTTNGLAGAKYDTVSADNYYMEPIATQLLSATAATITFANIPQGYKHLQLRQIARLNVSDTGTEITKLQFNGDTSASYSSHNLFGNGSAGAGNTTSQTFANCGALLQRSNTTSVFTVGITDILDYSNVYKFKTVRTLTGGDDNTAGGWLGIYSGLWQNTAGITKIVLTPTAAIDFGVNSRFSLYGIKG